MDYCGTIGRGAWKPYCALKMFLVEIFFYKVLVGAQIVKTVTFCASVLHRSALCYCER